MKKRILLLLTYFFVPFVYSQNYQTVEEVDNICSQLGFASDEDAQLAVDRILRQIGLPSKGFTLKSCPNINNAVAKNIMDSSGKYHRYILYDNQFMSRIENSANTDWSAISILAHEIGHHLIGHSLNNEGSNLIYELEADYWSGWALAKLGASLEEAQSAIQSLRYEKATATHPAKKDRLLEIEKGWNDGAENSGVNSENVVSSNEMYDVGVSYQVKKNYEEAITWYKKAADKGNDKAMYEIGEIYYSNLISLGQNSTNNTQSNNVKPKRGMLSMTGTNPVVEKLPAASKENYEEALIWFNKAAALENVDAYYKLGVMNENGFGTQQNYPEAFKWYLKAAENQNDMSMLRLAYFYKEGLGVEKDKNLSKSWYRKAQETHNLSKD